MLTIEIETGNEALPMGTKPLSWRASYGRRRGRSRTDIRNSSCVTATGTAWAIASTNPARKSN